MRSGTPSPPRPSAPGGQTGRVLRSGSVGHGEDGALFVADAGGTWVGIAGGGRRVELLALVALLGDRFSTWGLDAGSLPRPEVAGSEGN